MRVVLDANVLISAIISSRGSPAQILSYWQEGELDLVVSLPILEELDRVIHHPKLQARYDLREELVQEFLVLLGRRAAMVEPEERLAVIERDPTDNRYLECALAGEAQYLFSGDSHLLNLEQYEGIRILTPTEFLALLKLGES